MKKNMIFILGLILVLTLVTPVIAKVKDSSDVDKLSAEELKEKMIKEVGISEEDLKYIPGSVQRELVKEGAKLLGTNGAQMYPLDDGNESDFGIESISGLTLWGGAFSYTSDRPGYKKIRLYASFDWGDGFIPTNNFTDAFGVGYPSETLFFLPTSGGQVQQFHAIVSGKEEEYMDLEYEHIYYPDVVEVGAGVGYYVNLSHKFYDVFGDLSQYVYTEDSNSGTTNVLFRYGRSTTMFSPSFGIYPAGLAVTPTTTVDTADYIITFSY